MKRAEIQAAIRDLSPRSILAIDPDAHTPGAAWCALKETWQSAATRQAHLELTGKTSPASCGTHEDPPCWVWGGNEGGRSLASPSGARRVLTSLSPGLVLIEAALSSGGAFASSMHAQNIVRGGWSWLCQLDETPILLLPPAAWQRWLVATSEIARDVYRENKGKNDRTKRAYKAHARDLVGDGKPVNEDQAAALGMLDFALKALGASVGKVTRGQP